MTQDFIKSLGWFNRFAPPRWRPALTQFYTDTLQLPFLREGSQQPVDFLWAGEALIHELIYEGRTEASAEEGDPLRAPMLPIYRVTGLDDLLAALRNRGADIIGLHETALGREAFIVEPAGSLIGLREVPAASTIPQDIVANARRTRGEAFNPGCASMPQHWQELGWIRRRVADVDNMKNFYITMIGLKHVADIDGTALLDMGDNSLLELVPGGVVGTLPTNRAELPSTIILRITDIVTYRDMARDRGVRIVHDLIAWDRGALTYLADPENGLIGVEEKYHPSRYAPAQLPFTEDIEAQRRWAECRAATCA